ncbi:MAG: anti-sigma factor family protein [Thermoanaerobaculia bacterium]
MSEPNLDCARFEDWLSDGSAGPESEAIWLDHLEECSACRTQLATHRLLVEAFQDEPAPVLSPGFEGRLADRLRPAVRVRRLAGWRLAAMLAYGLTAALAMAWVLRNVSLPSIDLASGWARFMAMALVPPSLALAVFLSRFMPARNPGSPPVSGSGFMLGL